MVVFNAMTATGLYLLFALLALSGVAVGTYALARLDSRGAVEIAGIGFIHALTVFMQLLEFWAPTIEGKIFWDDAQWVPLLLWLVFFMRLAVMYAEYPRATVRTITIAFAALWLALLPAILTAGMHDLVRSGERLVQLGPIIGLTYELGLISYVLSAASLLGLLAAFLLLAARLRSVAPFHRPLLPLLLIAMVVPILGGVVSVAGVTIGPFRDFLPFTFTISTLLLGGALVRLGLLEHPPIPRSAVLTAMSEPLVVIDDELLIVDANPAALRALAIPESAIIHESLSDYVSDPGVELRTERATGQRISAAKGRQGRFEWDSRAFRVGAKRYWVIVFHDISTIEALEQVAMAKEDELRGLVEKLGSYPDEHAIVRQIHHQVRNNLQILASLSRIDTTSSGGPARTRFLDRIDAVAAAFEIIDHDSPFAPVDLGKYLAGIVHAHSRQDRPLEMTSARIERPVDRALPLGLLLNEIIGSSQNLLKPRGHITLEQIEGDADKLRLRIVREGGGAVSFTPSDVVEALVSQIGGRLSVNENQIEIVVDGLR
jgi:two-component sensor histidine kinase